MLCFEAEGERGRAFFIAAEDRSGGSTLRKIGHKASPATRLLGEHVPLRHGGGGAALL